MSSIAIETNRRHKTIPTNIKITQSAEEEINKIGMNLIKTLLGKLTIPQVTFYKTNTKINKKSQNSWTKNKNQRDG
jgi:hypothetical protein